MPTNKTSYKDAGVDIDKAASFVDRIKPLIKPTLRSGTVGEIGHFGGLFHLDPDKYKNPLLVSATDGVGTKLQIAHMMDIHNTVGIDLVAMSVNDLIVQGAEPLFFLDYIATGKLKLESTVQIVEGITKGCIEAGCALIGGETAEMPGFYKDNEYDLAGFCVGVVEYDNIIDGSRIRTGDSLIGLKSNGVHSNGYSLVRKVLFEQAGIDINDSVEGIEGSLGMELLRPTKIYVKTLLNLIKIFEIRGIAHITGGGLTENIPRILPRGSGVLVDRKSWNPPPIFGIIQDIGDIDESEMLRVFNMGIGMVIVVPEKDSKEIVSHLELLGEQANIIGHVTKREDENPAVMFE
ncbi:MAG: phosphoribosylformylglycinamidine cyclo-ligase [Thermodesulfobacteriota bacterium]|nr:phosphoribosylformylglycinamidine cyclo-ligase [Thermodesulfobacteriota bacterium]